MKKFVLLFILGLISAQFIFANAETSLVPRPDLVITIKIRLHTRVSHCETGFGFCRFIMQFTLEDNKSSGEELISAKASINSQNQLIIKFTESDLKAYENGSMLKYFESKKSIKVTENYELSSEVSKALGSPTPLVIKEGNYNIDYNLGIYIMTIPL